MAGGLGSHSSYESDPLSPASRAPDSKLTTSWSWEICSPESGRGSGLGCLRSSWVQGYFSLGHVFSNSLQN